MSHACSNISGAIHCADGDLHAAAQRFTGELEQRAPMYSAVRIRGERLYHAARRGEDVERPARAVSVSAFELSRHSDSSQDVAYRIVCSKGTYVRSLIHNLVRHNRAANRLCFSVS